MGTRCSTSTTTACPLQCRDFCPRGSFGVDFVSLSFCHKEGHLTDYDQRSPSEMLTYAQDAIQARTVRLLHLGAYQVQGMGPFLLVILVTIPFACLPGERTSVSSTTRQQRLPCERRDSTYVSQDVLFSRSLEAEYHLRADKLNQPLDSCSQTDKTCSATTMCLHGLRPVITL